MALTSRTHAAPNFLFDRVDFDQRIRVREIVLASEGNTIRQARIRYEALEVEGAVVVRGQTSRLPQPTAETSLVGHEYVVADARRLKVLEVDGSPAPTSSPEALVVARTLMLTHWGSLSHHEDEPAPMMGYVPIPLRVTLPDEPHLAKGIRMFLALETSLVHFGLRFAPPRVEDDDGVPVVVRAFDVFDHERFRKPSRLLKGHGEIRFGPHDLPLSFVFSARREDDPGAPPPEGPQPELTSSVQATWTYRLPTGVTWPHERSTGAGSP